MGKQKRVVNTARVAVLADKYVGMVNGASPKVIADGTKWYAEATSIAVAMVTNYASRGIRVSLEEASTVLAAFSPNTPWARNIFLAMAHSNGLPTPTMGSAIRAAEQALCVGFDALKGRKTNSFARNIAGDLSVVTVDVWMYRSAGVTGSVHAVDYEEIAQAVCIAAQATGLQPAEVQAIIWILARGSAE